MIKITPTPTKYKKELDYVCPHCDGSLTYRDTVQGWLMWFCEEKNCTFCGSFKEELKKKAVFDEDEMYKRRRPKLTEEEQERVNTILAGILVM